MVVVEVVAVVVVVAMVVSSRTDSVWTAIFFRGDLNL